MIFHRSIHQVLFHTCTQLLIIFSFSFLFYKNSNFTIGSLIATLTMIKSFSHFLFIIPE